MKYAEAVCISTSVTWPPQHEAYRGNKIVRTPWSFGLTSLKHRDNKTVSAFPSFGFTSVRHTEAISLYEHCLHHKCSGQRRSTLHGEGKKTENVELSSMTEWSGQGSDDVIPQCDDSTRLWVLTCISWIQELGKFRGDSERSKHSTSS